jgi:hypothetical protein
LQSGYAGIENRRASSVKAVFSGQSTADGRKHVKRSGIQSGIKIQVSVLLFCCMPFLLSSQTIVQDSLWLNDDWYFSAEDPSFIDITNFLPSFFKDEAHLKRYLRDDRFYELRKSYDDTLAVDAIFDRAMLIADNDVQHALLIATFAVMDHRRLGLRIPLIGSVYLPLTFESDSVFRVRRTHLPKKLLEDNRRASDKDKLQHFFGSAYVAYMFNSNAIARWFGDLLETGEESFVLGGRIDERDKLANEKGREFGLRLLHDARTMPSDVLWK